MPGRCFLSRYSGSDDVLFGATWSGRAGTIDPSVRVVGPLVNTLPVRVRLREAGTVRELLGALRRQHLALRPFQQTALGDIRARSHLAGFAQLFETSVVFENERFDSTLSRQDGRWRGHKLWSRSQTSLPLVLAAYFQDGVLVTDLEHDVALYPQRDGAPAALRLSTTPRKHPPFARRVAVRQCPCSTSRRTRS